MEFSGKLPVGITVKVIDELLAVGLEWGGFFGSHRSGNSWTFLTLFAFIGIRLFPRFCGAAVCAVPLEWLARFSSSSLSLHAMRTTSPRSTAVSRASFSAAITRSFWLIHEKTETNL